MSKIKNTKQFYIEDYNGPENKFDFAKAYNEYARELEQGDKDEEIHQLKSIIDSLETKAEQKIEFLKSQLKYPDHDDFGRGLYDGIQKAIEILKK